MIFLAYLNIVTAVVFLGLAFFHKNSNRELIFLAILIITNLTTGALLALHALNLTPEVNW